MKNTQNHLPSLFSSLLFIVGAVLLLGVGLVMGVTAFASVVIGTGISAQQTIFLVAFGFEGVVLLAAAYFSIQKYRQKPAMDEYISLPASYRLLSLILLIAVLSLLVGYWLGGFQTINWLVLPILTIPAIVLPLGALLLLGTRGLPIGTRWQTWSVLGLAMTLTPFFLLILEVMIAILLFIVIVAYILTQPELASQIQGVFQQIMILGPESEAARELLSPFLMRPGVILSALIYVAVLVPAVEEIFKPLGVWLFAAQLDSAAQGFALGALSGAGYALIETVGVSGQQTADWASLLSSRIGTGLLHITTSAIMGAAIVLAWRQRRYLRLLGTYLFAIFLHGLWNALATLYTFSTLANVLNLPSGLLRFQPEVIAGMGVLAVGLFVLLLVSNRRMRKMLVPSPIEPQVRAEDPETH